VPQNANKGYKGYVPDTYKLKDLRQWRTMWLCLLGDGNWAESQSGCTKTNTS